MSERGSILADSLAAACLLTAGMLLLAAVSLTGQSAGVREARMTLEMEKISALRIVMMNKGALEHERSGK